MKDLMDCLNKINNKWPEIGIALNVSKNDIDSIKEEHPNNTRRLGAVLQIWMDRDQSVTWQAVIEALEGPIVDNPRIAREIKEFLASTGKLNVIAFTAAEC